MKIMRLHRWPRDAQAAIRLQRRLAPQVRLVPLERGPQILAGADAAVSPDGQEVIGGVVVWDCRRQAMLEQRVARVPCQFPYIPGLLSFRELPGLLAALRKLRSTPGAVLCDAHGLAHPRGLGLSCHLGLWLNLPTVGCAKSRLCGTYAEPPPQRGGQSPLWHEGRQVGVVLRTRDNVRPVFVSPGHLCDLAGAVQLTLLAATRYRLPEPIRLAHQAVTAARGAAAAGPQE